MAQYLVRVELFGASASGYEDLHEVMGAIGLKRTVTYSDGDVRSMPTGTYFGESSLDVTSLRDRINIISKPFSPSKAAAVFACSVQPHQWAAFLYKA
jgi:hypothetical protein|uniref:hypothetical protein n=1 Tax=Pseudomonas fluorescens TaxID=294 RepID=UPI00124151FC|nr:hypothetical protein [Pseudomonas fluorescens]